MPSTNPAHLITVLIMIVMFLAAPWLAGKLAVRPRSFPESALACAGLVAAAALLGYAAQRTAGQDAWYLATFCILVSLILLATVVFAHTTWIKPLRKWTHPRAGITLILGRVSMISLSFAVLARSIQLHPEGLSLAWGGGLNAIELVAQVVGLLTAFPFIGLAVFAVVMHRRAQKAAAAEG